MDSEKNIKNGRLTRPTVYQLLWRLGLGLAVKLIADKLNEKLPGLAALTPWLLAAAFALMTLAAVLRFRGAALPDFAMKRLYYHRKTPEPVFDAADTLPENRYISFEKLSDREKDICLIVVNAVCCLVFLALSAFSAV